MYRRNDWPKRLALGATGGLAGTCVIQLLLSARQKWLPRTQPPMRQEPGAFMVEKGEKMLPDSVQQRIPQRVETGAALTLAAGYGLTFGALYTLLRPQGGSAMVDGVLLGLANWATGYVGWMPATGLMPPLWHQKKPQVIAPIVEHTLYGMATVATYNWLRKRL
jgi:uncharacterized membrane protein YagU involved in acid resistance